MADNESAQPVGQVRVLGMSRVWPSVAAPAFVLAVLVLACVLYALVSLFGIAAATLAVVLALARRQNAVLADDVGLLIRRRGTLHRSYSWSDIERMGWRDAGWWGSALLVHPRGGPYEVPGPNSPVDVARLWHPRRSRLADPVLELALQHGIKPLP